jgi:hypothetical protein
VDRQKEKERERERERKLPEAAARDTGFSAESCARTRTASFLFPSHLLSFASILWCNSLTFIALKVRLALFLFLFSVRVKRHREVVEVVLLPVCAITF